jgi:uncharacterized protein involved in exopolysaccharide biosynthesis
MDRVKLIKLLNLTTSSNDNEALTALRFINRMMVSNNKSWEELVNKNNTEYQKLKVEYNTLVNMYNHLLDKYRKLLMRGRNIT